MKTNTEPEAPIPADQNVEDLQERTPNLKPLDDSMQKLAEDEFAKRIVPAAHPVAEEPKVEPTRYGLVGLSSCGCGWVSKAQGQAGTEELVAHLNGVHPNWNTRPAPKPAVAEEGELPQSEPLLPELKSATHKQCERAQERKEFIHTHDGALEVLIMREDQLVDAAKEIKSLRKRMESLGLFATGAAPGKPEDFHNERAEVAERILAALKPKPAGAGDRPSVDWEHIASIATEKLCSETGDDLGCDDDCEHSSGIKAARWAISVKHDYDSLLAENQGLRETARGLYNAATCSLRLNDERCGVCDDHVKHYEAKGGE